MMNYNKTIIYNIVMIPMGVSVFSCKTQLVTQIYKSYNDLSK